MKQMSLMLRRSNKIGLLKKLSILHDLSEVGTYYHSNRCYYNYIDTKDKTASKYSLLGTSIEDTFLLQIILLIKMIGFEMKCNNFFEILILQIRS